jgi:hypothetical protein
MILKDTHELDTRRETLENGYITLMTFSLAGDGYLAATSRFDNWLPVLLSVGIAAFAIASTARYTRAVKTLALAQNSRYAWLRELEATDALVQLRLNVLTQEFKQVYQPRERRSIVGRALNLGAIFVISFVAISLLLAGVTAASHVADLHQLVRPLTAP